LGKIATRIVQQGGGDGVEIIYLGGLWTRRVGSDYFPDSPSFDYTYAHFHAWTQQMEAYISDARDYWLQHYTPQEGHTIVDVGAGRGEDTVAFSRAVGKTGRVIAIEAHPLSFRILKRFCELNRLTNVIPIELAAMHEPGTPSIIESRSSWTENTIDFRKQARGIKVRAATLAQVWKEQGLTKVDFLKMNIEGAERYALPGLEPVIDRVRQICVACHDFRYNRGEGQQFRTREFVESFLLSHGFRLASRPHDPRLGIRDHVYGLRG
jgi:FkbM family methyltransferase